MLRLVIFALSIILLMLLSYTCVTRSVPDIHADLARRSLAALNFNGLYDLVITPQGQQITLSGTVADEQQRDLAEATVRSVWGVAKLVNELQIDAPPPFELNLDYDGHNVLLSGFIPPDLDADHLVSALREQFGAAQVTVSLQAVSHAPAHVASIFNQAMRPLLAKLSFGAISLTPVKLDVDGRLAAQTQRAEVEQLLSQALPDGMHYVLHLTPSKGTPTRPQPPTKAPALSAPTQNASKASASKPEPPAQTPTPSATGAGKSIEAQMTIETCQRAIEAALRSRAIEFASGQSTLDAASHPILNDIAQAFANCSNRHLRVAGHTDNRGSESANLKLSQARAEAVCAYLSQHGVPISHCQAKGFGESQPIADNGTRAGQAKNRRIEFLVRP